MHSYRRMGLLYLVHYTNIIRMNYLLQNDHLFVWYLISVMFPLLNVVIMDWFGLYGIYEYGIIRSVSTDSADVYPLL